MIERAVTDLPDPELADDAKRLAGLDVERQAFDGLERSLLGCELD